MTRSCALFAGDLPIDAADLATELSRNGFTIILCGTLSLQQSLVSSNVNYIEIQTAEIPRLLSNGEVEISVLVAGFEGHSSENIDIGTHALVRALAAEFERVLVIIEYSDYQWLKNRIVDHATLSTSIVQRRLFAAKAFHITASIDEKISKDLSTITDGLVVLIIGKGGREDAISRKLAESPLVMRVFVAPGNGGTDQSNSKVTNIGIRFDDENGLVSFAQQHHVGLVLISPSPLLKRGMIDAMTAAGIPAFGPSSRASRLEGWNAFSRAFLARHGIKTAKLEEFSSFEGALEFIQSKSEFPIVLKAQGKSSVALSYEQAVSILRKIQDRIQSDECNCNFVSCDDNDSTVVVIEDMVVGREVSLFAFVDGKRAVCMPPVRTYRRASENDQGAITGGMGTCVPCANLPEEICEKMSKILERVVAAMDAEGTPMEGVLGVRFMVTENEVVVVGLDVRIGDPETQALIPLLDSDLAMIIQACVERRLTKADVKWKTGIFSVCVVLVSDGIDTNMNLEVQGLDEVSNDEKLLIFHTDTRIDGNKVVRTGGRVVALTGIGESLEEARNRVHVAARRITSYPKNHLRFREDIGII